MHLLRFFAPPSKFDPKNPDQYFQTDQVKAEIKERTVRGGVVIAGAQVIKQVFAIGSAILLARLVLPGDTGLVVMVTAITGFIETIDDLGLSAATVQWAKINQRQVSSLFWINIALGTLLALLTAALSPLIAWFYHEPRLTPITLVIASTFFFRSLTFQHKALLRRQMMVTSLSLIDVLSTVISIVVGIGAALTGFSYWSLVLMRFVSAPIQIIAVWYLCPWRPSRPARVAGLRLMLAFGSNLAGFRLINYFARNLDSVLIGYFFGAVPVGLYNKAYRMLLIPLHNINEPFAGVAWPALSRLLDSPQRYRQAYTRIVAKLCLVTMPLVAWIIGSADWFILVFLGPKWMGTTNVLAWLGIFGLVQPFSATTSWLFVSQGRTQQQFHYALINAALTIVSIVVGLRWGPIGVAAAYGIVGLLIRTPLLFWFAGRAGPVTTMGLYRDLAPFASVACAVLVSLFAFRLWVAGTNPLLNLVAAAGITAVVSLVVLVILPSGRETLLDLKILLDQILKMRGNAAS
jgi:PST family polysaccharide transporter